MNYNINHWYKYPTGKKRFKLQRVDVFIFIFECGHRVTDTVFMDLIPISNQLQLPLLPHKQQH